MKTAGDPKKSSWLDASHAMAAVAVIIAILAVSVNRLNQVDQRIYDIHEKLTRIETILGVDECIESCFNEARRSDLNDLEKKVPEVGSAVSAQGRASDGLDGG